ncbi:hypothetical protein PIB30_047522 [Stylosanthes scabra]|uniref:Uncharacterized protein n=1 Tax=Stylosanthes scabra TaxID=79078 RepID=A0ABU6XEG1_9FABA|nr:hypothetical protein [Stylosanthes scabra]
MRLQQWVGGIAPSIASVTLSSVSFLTESAMLSRDSRDLTKHCDSDYGWVFASSMTDMDLSVVEAENRCGYCSIEDGNLEKDEDKDDNGDDGMVGR